MKVFCGNHGAHFKEDTNYEDCPFWDGWGFSRLNKKYRKIIFNWLFALPVDEIAIKQKIAIEAVVRGTPIKKEVNQFAKYVPGYKKLTEKDQQIFQKDYFMFIHQFNDASFRDDFMLQLYFEYKKRNLKNGK